MLNPLVITVADFAGIRQINQNQQQAKKLDPFIREAQELDLKPLMGASFYQDFVDNFTTEQKYIDLLAGVKYENTLNETVSFSGLTAALVYWTYGRYSINKPITDTPFGQVNKTNQWSKQIDKDDRRSIVSQTKSAGNNYWIEVTEFLNIPENNNIYKLWKSDCKTGRLPRSGRFHKVQRGAPSRRHHDNHHLDEDHHDSHH